MYCTGLFDANMHAYCTLCADKCDKFMVNTAHDVHSYIYTHNLLIIEQYYDKHIAHDAILTCAYLNKRLMHTQHTICRGMLHTI